MVELRDAQPAGRTSPGDPANDSETQDAEATSASAAVDKRPGGDTPPWDVPAAPREPAPVGGIPYPEWDGGHKRYRAGFVAVHHDPAPEGHAASTIDVRREHAAVIRRVRERFERMQSRRTRMTHQRDGDELDLDACVSALVDSRSGRVPDDRVYVAVRPGRRPVAITLLVDASGSASDQVSPTRTVIDVEKVAVLLAGEALEALGDPYAILTFSSRGAAAVRVTSVKDFAERTSDRVRRRIWAIEPNGNTRLGAAVRHATALLARQPAGHRLLLIVSDGKPNDMDGYQGAYAIEDSRQAIFEARAQGIVSFCLTVDSDEPEYAPHIFGPAGYTVLRRPEQLPFVLLAAVRRLLAS